MATAKETSQVTRFGQAPPSVVVPFSTDEEAATRWRSIHYLRRRRCAFCCCGCCGATVVVLGITVLILSLTVFKIKDPTLTMNSLSLDDVGVGPGGGSGGDDLVLLNATLIADISIRNPNVASFKFDNSTTDFFYKNETVGSAYVPAGEVGAHRTARMNVTVDVLTNRVVRKMNITADALVFGKVVNLTSFTDISGRVNVLGVYKRNLDVKMSCNISLEVSTLHQEMKNIHCSADVN